VGSGGSELLCVAPGTESSIQEILMRIKINSLHGGLVEIRVGADAQESRSFRLQDGLQVFGDLGGRSLRIGGRPSEAFNWQTYTWYWLRFRQTGTPSVAGAEANKLQAKLWLADGEDVEPSDWQFETASDNRVGSAGFRAVFLDPVGEFDVDYILIKTPDLPEIQVASQLPTETEKPSVVQVTPRGNPNGVDVVFSEPVSAESARNPAHYAIDHGVTIESVEMLDSHTVRLHTSPISLGILYTLTVNSVQDTAPIPNTIEANTQVTFLQTQGVIERRDFLGIDGAEVFKLTQHPNFPDQPDAILYLDQLEFIFTGQNHFGAQLRGYVSAPTTGDYTFYLTSGGPSVLYLSSDENPANKQLIAITREFSWFFRAWATVREESSVSKPISLQTGHRYYIEALMKDEVNFAEYLSVAWVKPGDPPLKDGDPPIPGQFLSTLADSGPLQFESGLSDMTVTEGQEAAFSVQLKGSPPYQYKWFRDDKLVSEGSGYRIPAAAVADNAARIRVEVSNAFSRVISSTVTLHVNPDQTPPAPVSASGSHSHKEVTLVFSEPVSADTAIDTANYSFSDGLTIRSARISQDGRTVTLLTDRQSEGVRYTLAIRGLTDRAATPNEIAPGTTVEFTAWVLARGALLREVWKDLGTPISNLLGSPKFPDSPDELGYVNTFESPLHVADGYSQKLSGWLTPPVTGDYLLYLSADDEALLYLSSDDDPLKKTLVATEPQRPSAGGVRDYLDTANAQVRGNPPSSVSAPTRLQAAHRYYVEVLHAEGDFTDGVSVAWLMPGEPKPVANVDLSPIPGEFLAAYANPDFVSIQITGQPQSLNLAGNSTAGFTVTAQTSSTVGSQPLFQWLRDGVEVAGATEPRYAISNVRQEDNGARFRCRLELGGVSVLSEEATLSVFTPAGPGVLTITSPAANSVVSGPITLAVNSDGIAGINSIEYLLNGRPMFESGDPVLPLRAYPYSLTWRTANVWDGFHTIEAVARNAAGQIIQASAPVPFQIANRGVTLTLVSPNPTQTLSGTINWTVETDYQLKPGEVYFWLFAIDGKEHLIAWFPTPQYTATVDTTALRNGKHELFCQLGIAKSGIAGMFPMAMSQVFVQVDNGRAPMELRANYKELHLTPGEPVDLFARVAFTNGDEEIVAATFSSLNMAVASVGPDGLVTGVSPGNTYIEIESAGKSNRVRVVVRAAHILPHFSKSGELLSSYDPDKSLFVRTLFFLSGYEINQFPNLGEATVKAGINALMTGFYYNPADSPPGSYNWESWKRDVDVFHARQLIPAERLDLSIYLTGDDLARSPEELRLTITDPDAPARVRHVLEWAKSSGRVIGIDMIDEANLAWGDTPTPTDGRWLSSVNLRDGRVYEIPDDAFIKLMGILNSVPDRPKVTWSVLGHSSATEVANWTGNPAFADYNGIYWGERYESGVYPHARSVHQLVSRGMDGSVLGWEQVLQKDKPSLLLMANNGPCYGEQGDDGRYTAGEDVLCNPQWVGMTPNHVALQAIYAVIRGMAGVRVYAFDFLQWKIDRLSAGQTGSDPFTVGVERWKAMSTAFNLVKELEPFILQPNTHAVDLGSNLLTGAKRGSNGNLFLALNISEMPEPIKPDLTTYRIGLPIHRYRLLGSRRLHDVIPDSTRDELTLEAGEGVIYLFTSDQWIDFAPLPNRTVGDPPFELSATSSAGLPVSLSVVSGPATIAGSTLTVTGAGDVVVKAAQPGDGQYRPAPEVTQRFTVFQADQTIDFAPLPARTHGEPPFVLQATASSGLPVSFAVAEGPAVLSGTTLRLTGPGTVVVRASQAGNDYYFPAANVVRMFVVRPAVLEVLPIADQELDEGRGSLLNVAVKGAEYLSDGLRFSLEPGAPFGASLDERTGALRWTPLERHGPGSYPVSVTVRYLGPPGQTQTIEFTLNVREVNTPPGLAPISDRAVDEEKRVSFVVGQASFEVTDFVPGLVREVYDDIFGGTLANLLSDPRFPDEPSSSSVIDKFEAPVDVAENYGQRLSGWLLPSATGDYTFWIASDDASKLFLSSDESPANKVEIASVPEWTAAREWTKYPQQESAPVSLSADRLYYVEALMVEGSFGDHLEVRWRLPDGRIEDPIPSSRLRILGTALRSGDADLPAQKLTFGLELGAPAGATIDPVSGFFSWTPTEEQGPREYEIAVRLTDDGSPALSDVKTFRVAVGEVNSAPQLAAIAVQLAEEERQFTLTPTVTDVDLPPNQLTWALDPGAPEGMAIDPATGVIHWTPSEGEGGASYPVTVRVADDGTPSRSASRTFTVTVGEVNSAPVLDAISETVLDEGTQLRFTASANDGDLPVQRLTFSLGPGAPDGASIDAASGAFVWTPSEAQGPGVFPITVVVTDDGTPSLTDSKTFSVTVNEVNSAPRLVAIADESADELSELTFAATATDIDEPPNNVTLSVSGLPAGASFDPATGKFTWAPGEEQQGTYTVTFTATDDGQPNLSDSKLVTIMVNEVNRPPELSVVSDQSVDELGELTFAATASDPNDSPPNKMTLSASGLPEGASFDPATGEFRWTPSEGQGPGSYVVTITATDDGVPPLSASQTVTITVREVNNAPKLSVVSDQSSDELSELTFAATASDPNDTPPNKVTLSASGLPDGAIFGSATGKFTWTPTEAQGPGTYSIAITATDDGVPPLSASETVTITVREVNNAPKLSVVSEQLSDELSELTFAATASDPNDTPANRVTLSASGLPDGGSFDPATGEFRWTPTEEQGPGSYSVTITAADDGVPGKSVSQVVAITVGEMNSPPKLSVVSDQQAEELSDLTFAATATDADVPKNTLTFSLAEGAPAGTAIDPATGVFTWTPSESQGPGVYPVTVIVTDSGSPALSDAQTFTLTVSEVNRPPELSVASSQLSDELSELTFAATASDADVPANKVTLSANGLPEGSTFDPATGEFRWAPTEEQGPGTYTITFTATDDGVPPQNTSQSVTITVKEVNAPPVLPPIGNKSVDEHQVLAFTVAASDANDSPPNGVTLSAAGLPIGASFDPATGAFSWTPGEEQQGAHQVVFTATDDGTPPLSVSETITITVNEVNDPPTVVLVAPPPGAQFIAPATIQIEATASDPEGALARVEFFDGSTRLGEATDRPYALRWENVVAGQHTLTAKATDEQGASATSASVGVEVLASLRSAEVLADGSFRVTLLGEPHRQYAIEASEDLKAWTSLRTETVSAAGTLRFVDATALGATQRFYRAVRMALP
jgi:hypothetical protein